LGKAGFLGFKNMIAAIQIEYWEGASKAALDSKWKTQVGSRATEIASMLREG
jgi:lysozyme